MINEYNDKWNDIITQVVLTWYGGIEMITINKYVIGTNSK
jgi:hypothetical protein